MGVTQVDVVDRRQAEQLGLNRRRRCGKEVPVGPPALAVREGGSSRTENVLPGGTPSQLRMADACVRAGVGRTTTRDGVAEAVRLLLSDCDASDRARALAQEIAAMPDATEVVADLEDVKMT
jgi:hypothetical protein